MDFSKFILASLLFSINASLVPDDGVHWKDVILGAAIGVAGCVAVQKAFSLRGRPANVGSIVQREGEDSVFDQQSGQFQVPQIPIISDTGVRLVDFIGQPLALGDSLQFVDSVVSYPKYKEVGVARPKALLIEGDSGNGKTLLASAIASELKAIVIPLNSYFLVDGISGMGEAKLKFIFNFARQFARERRIALLLEGIDFFAQRGEFYKHNAVNRALVRELVSQIGMIEDDEDLIVIGTAGSIVDLDPLLFKQGCFDNTIHIMLPSLNGRKQISANFLKTVSLRDEADVERLSDVIGELSAGFTAELLKEVVNGAALLAVQSSSRFVEEEHVVSSIQKVREKKRLLLGKDDQEDVLCTFSEATKFKDVVGLHEELVEVKESVDFLINPERYTELGAHPPRGILLHGPAGCGKTLIARAIAGESKCFFISVSGSEFVKKYVGTGAMMVRHIFDLARKKSREIPVYIFIDEIDGLGRRQNTGVSSGQTEYNNTLNELLKQMDGFSQNDRIHVIGATNLLEEIDPALLRSGRFDRKICIPLPDKTSRSEILKFYLKKLKLSAANSVDEISDSFTGRTIGFSGADIECFANEAAIVAARLESPFVRTEHFEGAFDKIVLGVRKRNNLSDEQIYKVAVHEGGHALVASLLGIPVYKASILPRGGTGGVTWMRPKYENLSNYSKKELMYDMACAYAGRTAEDLVFNETNFGASSDLNKANSLARRMVHKGGMGTGRLRCVTAGAISSDAMQEKLDEEVVSLIENVFDKSTLLVERYRPLLIELAESLQKNETIDEAEIRRIVGDKFGSESF